MIVGGLVGGGAVAVVRYSWDVAWRPVIVVVVVTCMVVIGLVSGSLLIIGGCSVDGVVDGYFIFAPDHDLNP